MRITIDGIPLEVKGKKTLLETARENDIYIPSLCDHSQLAPFSGCRLCIVEIKGRRGFMPSCSTYPEDGMEVRTDTAKLRKMRRQILELILSEHPDACLVCTEKKFCDEYKSTIRKVGEVTGCVLCPNNGRCELQEVVEAVGIEKVSFPSVYRNHEVRNDDPFFDRNYNLCILCGRCVRVCRDIRGASAVSFVFRGSDAAVGTVLDRPLHESGCQFCGACVDVCPTGALTERATKYDHLPEDSARTICPLCSIGCELEVMLHEGRILGAKPSEESPVNKGQACVKGRFVIKDTVYGSKKVLWPMIRKKKDLEMVSWDEALEFVAQKLKAYKGTESAVVHSSQISCEDHYVVHQFARKALRTWNMAMPAPISPLADFFEIARKNGLETSFNFRIEDISTSDVIFLAGTDLVETHPILWLEVLKAVQNGTKLIAASPVEPIGIGYVNEWLPIRPESEDFLLNSLSKLVIGRGPKPDEEQRTGFESFRRFLNRFDLSKALEAAGIKKDRLDRIAELLMEAKTFYLCGAGLVQYPWGNQNLAALWNLSLLTKGLFLSLGQTSNERGLLEINRALSRKLRSPEQIRRGLEKREIKALYLMDSTPFDENIQPEFLVVQSSYRNKFTEKADAVLPAATFAESEGIFINVEGRVQKGNKVIQPVGGARPDWWIISQLAKKMGNKNFDYKKPSDILKKMRGEVPAFAKISASRLKKGKSSFVQEKKKGRRKFLPLKSREWFDETSKKYPFLLWSLEHTDFYRNLDLAKEVKGLGMLRNANWFKLNPADAEKLGLKEEENIEVISTEGKRQGIMKTSESVPKGMVVASRQQPLSCVRVKIERGS